MEMGLTLDGQAFDFVRPGKPRVYRLSAWGGLEAHSCRAYHPPLKSLTKQGRRRGLTIEVYSPRSPFALEFEHCAVRQHDLVGVARVALDLLQRGVAADRGDLLGRAADLREPPA